MEKINILVVPSDRSGVGYFRSTNPHIRLQESYPNEFFIDINYEPNFDDEAYLKKFHIVHFHRSISNKNKSSIEIIKYLKSLGIQVVMDIDDNWYLPKEHPAFYMNKVSNLKETVRDNARESNWVTTTTDYFGNIIKERHNSNVMVLPNAIDVTDKQYSNDNVESDKIRIGYLGGSSHFHDLLLLSKMFSSLRLNFKDKIQIVLCGFDVRGTIETIDPKTNKRQTRNIMPHESIWCKYEHIFTDGYKLIEDQNYMKYLSKFSNEPYPNEENMVYRRVWTKPITSYATNYNLFDISLAPLVHNQFNRVKSQLKAIEAGNFKKALIAENIEPYKIDVINNKNGFIVDSDKKAKEWYQRVVELIRNPNKIKDLGEALNETVMSKYTIDKINIKRKEFYQSIVNQTR
jgi:glycosyltransferase involved in cell wall biosynthesis